jgi:hypothetical protein
MNCDTEEVSIRDLANVPVLAAIISKLTNVKHQNP